MGKHIDISGQVFGRLTVIRRAQKGTAERGWLCQCECGNTVWQKSVCAFRTVKSCGCWYREFQRVKHVIGCNNHKPVAGLNVPRSHMPEYSVWSGMKRRCFNPNEKAYPDYGGRGITISERWLSFDNFYADMGPRPSNRHEIDRIDFNGHYEPGNCRWLLGEYQARNSRKARQVTYAGVTMPVSDWADLFGVRPKILYQQTTRVGHQEAIRRHVVSKAVFCRDMT